jgi:hypothetical protein
LYFRKVERFLETHYEEGNNYREFLKCSNDCLSCDGWVGPTLTKCLRPYPDNSALPEYHYLAYDKMPLGERDIDDWQPRAQVIKQFAENKLSSSDPESVSAFADKYIVKPKLVLEYVKHLEVKEWKKEKNRNETAENVKRAKEKMYSDYAWDNVVKDDKELKRLRVCELNKYLVHNGLHKYLKNPYSPAALVFKTCGDGGRK